MSLGVQLPICRAAQESKDNPVIRGRPLSISHTCRFPHLLNRCTASVPCHYHPPLILNPLSWNHCRGTNIHAFGDTAGGATAPTKFYSESHTPSLFLTKRWHRFRRAHRSCHSPYLMPRVHTQAHTYSRLVACRKTRANRLTLGANRLTLVASPFVYSSTLKH